MSAGATPVRELLAQRARYAQWLEELAARTAGAPAHVVAKVRADYEARLAAVRGALGSRVAELDAQRRTAVEARDAARAAEQAVVDARAEAELRHAVGEYAGDEWTALAAESDAALAMAAAERIAAEAALGDLERALGEVMGAGGAPAPPRAVSAPPPVPPRASSAPPPAPQRPPLVPPPAPAAIEIEREDLVPPTVTGSVERPASPVMSLDGFLFAPIDEPELSAHQSAVRPVVPAPPPPPSPRAAEPKGSARAPGAIRGTEAFDDLEFLKTLGRAPGAGVAPSAMPVPSGVSGPKVSADPAGPSTPPVAPSRGVPPVAPSRGVPPVAPSRGVPPVAPPPPPPRGMTPTRGITPPRGAMPPRPPVIPGPPPPPRISREFAPPPAPLPPDPAIASPEGKLFESQSTDPGLDGVRVTSMAAGSLRFSSAATAAKSLKCAECGAMNYPTEWYCERCGGELASL